MNELDQERVVAYQPLAPGARYPADALVEIEENGNVYRFVAEVKAAVDRPVAIGHVRAQLDQLLPGFPDHGWLLVTRFITPRMADECRQLDMALIDTAGDAFLRGPGLLVYVTGQGKPGNLKQVEYRANTQVGLKIIFALLCNPRWAAATYREIAHHAAAALGAVSPVLKDLENRGSIRKTETKEVFLENKRQLFDEWMTRYPKVLRPKLGGRRYQADPDRLLHADLAGLKAYWGEKAAELLTGYLHPERFTFYIEGPAPELLTKLRMRLDPNGDTEILKAFGRRSWTLQTKRLRLSCSSTPI